VTSDVPDASGNGGCCASPPPSVVVTAKSRSELTRGRGGE